MKVRRERDSATRSIEPAPSAVRREVNQHDPCHHGRGIPAVVAAFAFALGVLKDGSPFTSSWWT
jgi:hypothetical protein